MGRGEGEGNGERMRHIEIQIKKKPDLLNAIIKIHIRILCKAGGEE
jgi:hypothetical protein